MTEDLAGFPPQQQEPPGRTDAMEPVPDHGEESYVGSDRLQGRKALITGGDSGIGRAVAIAYAREGADVAFTYLPEESDDARETTRLVEEADAPASPSRPICATAPPATGSSPGPTRLSGGWTSWSTTPASRWLATAGWRTWTTPGWSGRSRRTCWRCCG